MTHNHEQVVDEHEGHDQHHRDHGHVGDDHGHHHSHQHQPAEHGRAFAIGVTLNVLFTVIEATYGYMSNSLALLADAGHNLGDVFGLLLGWGAILLAKRLPTQRRTYGIKRATILASLFNALLLLLAIGGIAWEAIVRLHVPAAVSAPTVIWVASIGILINGITAFLFMSGSKDDLNIRGAFVHMAADAAVSLGVVLAGIVLMMTGWLWIDPVVSLAVAMVILLGTWGLLRDSLNLALDAVPTHIDPAAVRAYLSSIPTVTDIHDLHIWSMSTTQTALTAHLIIPEIGNHDALLAQISGELNTRFKIAHATLQVEVGSTTDACARVEGCVA